MSKQLTRVAAIRRKNIRTYDTMKSFLAVLPVKKKCKFYTLDAKCGSKSKFNF